MPVWGPGDQGIAEGGSRESAHLAGRAVGHTGAPVAAQVEVGGTSTLVAAPGGQQAQVAAAAVVDLAGVVGDCRRTTVKGGDWAPSPEPGPPGRARAACARLTPALPAAAAPPALPGRGEWAVLLAPEGGVRRRMRPGLQPTRPPLCLPPSLRDGRLPSGSLHPGPPCLTGLRALGLRDQGGAQAG